MWVLLVQFLNYASTFLFRSVVIKFVMFTALVLLIAALASIVFNYIANLDIFGLNTLLNGLPDGLIYFLVVFQFHIGIPLMIGGLVTRFAIRRIPVIG